mmetsp:Transcript_47121/g.84984  ORF Transcript_47121/g.84984 Transcript_47121/m.84984 type:complete len:92 (+) Transcript_47121:615-890(+)
MSWTMRRDSTMAFLPAATPTGRLLRAPPVSAAPSWAQSAMLAAGPITKCGIRSKMDELWVASEGDPTSQMFTTDIEWNILWPSLFSTKGKI